MSVTISVSAILRNVAQLIGVPAFAANTNVTESQAVFWCQQALEALQALNAQHLGVDKHHISSINLPTQVGINFLSLPSDAIEVFDVIWRKDIDKAVRIVPAESKWVLPLGFQPRLWDRELPRFRLEGTSLVLYPCPAAVYQISIWYGQHFTVASPASTIQARLDWQNWIELDLACKCLARKRRYVDLKDFEGRRDALSAQLFSAGRQRMRAGPQRIQDVDGPDFRWWRYEP